MTWGVNLHKSHSWFTNLVQLAIVWYICSFLCSSIHFKFTHFYIRDFWSCSVDLPVPLCPSLSKERFKLFTATVFSSRVIMYHHFFERKRYFSSMTICGHLKQRYKAMHEGVCINGKATALRSSDISECFRTFKICGLHHSLGNHISFCLYLSWQFNSDISECFRTFKICGLHHSLGNHISFCLYLS